MLTSVEKRLAALEERSKPSEGLTIFRRFVRPGQAGPETLDPVAVVAGAWRMYREPGEAVEVFRARAAEAAPRDTWGVCVLRDVLSVD